MPFPSKVSHAYPTGRTKTFVITATLTAKRCGGAFIQSPDGSVAALGLSGVDSGWLGSDYFRIFTLTSPQPGWAAGPFGPYFGPIHSLSSGALGAFAEIRSDVLRITDDGGAFELAHGTPDTFRTRVIHCGETIFQYDDPAVPSESGVQNTPSTLTGEHRIVFAAAEWAFEIDSDAVESSSVNVRPGGATDPKLYLGWVPTGPIQSRFMGDVKTLDATGGIVFRFPDGSVAASNVFTGVDSLTMVLNGRSAGGFLPGQFECPTLPQTSGLGEYVPSDPTVSASAIQFDGMVPRWTSSISDPALPGSPGATFDGLQWVKFRTYENLLRHVFTIGETINGQLNVNAPISGKIRDFHGSLAGIPVAFDILGAKPILPLETREFLFSGSAQVNAEELSPIIRLPPSYNPSGLYPGDQGGLVLRWGNAWDALLIDRAKTLKSEDFTARWTGTDVTLDYADGVLTASATGGAPKLSKTLKSDFADMQVHVGGPEGWWQDHGGSLTALTATEAASADDWWNATGDPASTPHRGDWYRVGRRLLADSDVFNWSAFRYADLTASADADCDVSITLRWDEIAFAESGVSSYDAELTTTPKSATWTASLTTTDAARRIDLASRAGHHGLRYLTGIDIEFPSGRTIHLKDITLAEVNRPVIDVHLPSADISYLSAIGDGKRCLFLSTPDLSGPSVKPSSNWGWPVLRYIDGSFVSMTMDELAAEISLQEGWSASVAGNPDHGGPNYAVWLSERFKAACPATLLARRSFSSINVYPNFNQTIDLEYDAGCAIDPLVFDPATKEPVSVPIEADDSLGATSAASVTDATGAGELQLHKADGYEVYAGKGSATETSQGVTLAPRTIVAIDLTATPGEGLGNPCLCVDSDGNKYVAVVEEGTLKLRRLLGVEPDWSVAPIAPGVSSPWITINERNRRCPIHVVGEIPVSGTPNVSLLTNFENGLTGTWRRRLIADGSNPFVRSEGEAGILYIAYWRDGSVYLRRSSDEFASVIPFAAGDETTVIACPQQTFTFDILPNGKFIGVYSDASGVIQKIVSTDNGSTWS